MLERISPQGPDHVFNAPRSFKLVSNPNENRKIYQSMSLRQQKNRSLAAVNLKSILKPNEI